MSTPREWAADPRSRPAPGHGVDLLERAVGYTRASLQLVASTGLDAPTPCERWDLHRLLHHMDDGLAAFTDAAEIGYVDLAPVRVCDPTSTLVDRLKGRACALLAAWAIDPGPNDNDIDISVGDQQLGSDLLAAAGALEIAVHGWDVAAACGVDRPLPAGLALELLEVVPLLVGAADRPGRFGEPVVVPVHARPSTRLLAAVGRRAAR